MTPLVPRDVLFAVLTRAENRERHATIAMTWGALIPRGHLVLYSDQTPANADASLTFVAHAASQVPVKTPPSPSTGRKYMEAQDRFTYLVLPDAAARMRALGAQWLFLGDDDTFVWPENLSALLQGCDPSDWHWLGQGGVRNMFAGGAGFVASRAFTDVAAAAVANCTDIASKFTPYDARLGNCFARHLGVRITDAMEFNSQSPFFYATSQGRLDRPTGIGRAVTFHYLKAGTIRRAGEGDKPFAPVEFFRGLWAVTRAAEPAAGAASGGRQWHQCRYQPMPMKNGEVVVKLQSALREANEIVAKLQNALRQAKKSNVAMAPAGRIGGAQAAGRGGGGRAGWETGGAGRRGGSVGAERRHRSVLACASGRSG